MQTIDQFNDNLGTAIILCGGAGVGKTTLGMRLFPNTYVFVADLNFKSGKDYLEKIGQLGNIIGFDTSSPDETGKVVPPLARYDRMLNCLGKATKDPRVDAIFIDSGSLVEEIIKAKVASASTEFVRFMGKDTLGLWGNQLVTWKSITYQLRQSGKKIVISFHERKHQDEADQIYKYELDADGGIRNQLPKLVSDVWRCEILENLGKYVWNVRMLGNVRHEHLKRSSIFSDLPAVLSQDELVSFIHKKFGKPQTLKPAA